MRRAAAAVIVSGLAFGGMAAEPAVAGEHAGAAGISRALGTKTVIYGGYEIDVPAGWPVYRLQPDPTRCVRYDVSAVYLGTPGTAQRCPPGLIGRTQTLSIIPVPAARATPAIAYQRAAVGGESADAGRQDLAADQGLSAQQQLTGQPGMTRGERVRFLPRLRASIVRNEAQHQFRVATTAGVTVIATYGADPAVVERALATLRPAPPPANQRSVLRAGPAHTAPRVPAPASPPAPASALAPALGSAFAPGSGPGWSGPPGLVPDSSLAPLASPLMQLTGFAPASPASAAPSPGPRVTASPQPQGEPARPLAGFDTCTAPSLQAMRAWRAKYAVAGIYIGGVNAACDYGNLSRAWVRATTGMGWSLLPTYVGPQASCAGFSDVIKSRYAAAEGRAAAADAVSDAAWLGLGPGSPVYYDMEAYNESSAPCVAAVLTFLAAWTRELNAHGYLSGVYSSAGSGVRDLQSAATGRTGGHLAEPQAIWVALWDGQRNLSCSPYLAGLPWPVTHRSKQYAGGHWETVSGVSLDIDSDLVGSAVAR